MADDRVTLAGFLDSVAAKRPAPGGGAVSAVAGALAAAMGEMVLAYSVGKKGLEAHQAELADALGHLSRARAVLLQLVDEDAAAYEAVSALKKQSAGPEALAPAVLAAIRAPQAIAATASAVLAEARRVAPIANRWLLSDLAVCAELAMAAVRCGVHNVRVNLGDVSDPAERARLRQWCDDLQRRGVAVVRDLVPSIWSRIEATS